MDNFRPPSGLGPDPVDTPVEAASVEMKLEKLIAFLHLPIEWCERCGDWRDTGHVDHIGRAGAIQALLEEEQYPTVG